MPTEPYKPIIFISYAHADEPEKPAADEVKWLSFVTGYLRPAVKHGAVEIWIDRLMPGGADWEREIGQKLRACDIFILLASHHSLSSDYVIDKEIAIIRERQAKGEDVHFYPLVLTPTPKIALNLVRDKNLRPRDGKPFSDYSINERYRHMSEAADEIAELAGKIAATRRTPTASSLIGSNTVYQQLGGFTASPILPTQLSPPIEEVRGMEPEIKNRESLEIWLRGQTREVVITMASRTALRIAPLAAREGSSTHDNVNFESLVSTIFFANAFAWVASRYPSRANERAAAANRVGNTAHALARLDLGSVTLTAISAAAVAANAVADTGRVAIALAEKNASVAESVIDAVVGSVAAGIAFAASALESGWEQVRADVAALEKLDPHEVADLPLWAHDVPDWATDAWSSLTASLPVPHNWQVWIDWYEERLRGSSRREEYELLFASVPLEVWDQGPVAANAWIRAHLPPPSAESKIEIKDRGSLEDWLKRQSAAIAAAIAVRAALRVAPLVTEARERLGATRNSVLSTLTSAVFRASAVAWAPTKYSTHSKEFRAAAHAAADAIGSFATTDAAALAVEASAVAVDAAFFAPDAEAARFAAARAAAVAADAADDTAIWESIGADAAAAPSAGANGLMDLPLWSDGGPVWASAKWINLKAALVSDEDWEVWVGWYEDRLRGVSRGEAYELVFASVPLDVWDKGPTAANAWIKERLPGEESPKIGDAFSLDAWLSAQTRETAIVMAVRAALRVAPLAARITRKGLSPQQQRELTHLAGAIFRALASARVSVLDPDRIFVSAARNAAGAASDSSVVAIVAAEVARAAMFATSAAANSAAAAAAANPQTPGAAAAAVRAFVEAFKSADLSASDAEVAAWNQIRVDIEAIQRDGIRAHLEAPLWRQHEPTWVRFAVESLQAALPGDEDWDVWFGWYNQRLRGGSRGGDYELVFASVPQEEWDKGPAAANAWIKAHLPKGPGSDSSIPPGFAPPSPTLPPPLPDLASPFTYDWNAAWRITIVAGAQNLPIYRFFSSEEEHRHSLERCRVSAERLLESLRDGRYGNAVRREYAERLRYYLDDLPKIAGVGNIMLADDEVRVLHAMFAQDAEALPAPFAAALSRVIANQFALNDFYDVLRRHEQAVNAGNWTQPFPFEAARRFFGAVDENTPRLFEPEVGNGLHRVEQSAPLASSVPKPQPASSSAIQPPPLPAGAPDAEHSRQRQMATAANALWRVFLMGKDLPVAIEGWTQAAHKLGENVGPILDFLRGLGAPL